MQPDDLRKFAQILTTIADEMDAGQLEYKRGNATVSIDRTTMSVADEGLRMRTIPSGVHHVSITADVKLHTPLTNDA